MVKTKDQETGHWSRWLSLLCLVLVVSCTKDEDLYIPAREETLPAVISMDKTLNAQTRYQLSQPVYVTDSATLTLQAGVRIVAVPLEGEQLPALIIGRGSRIVAHGTAYDPVVLTSAIGEPGSWEGLTVLGQAPVSWQEPGAAEFGTLDVYGGDNGTDGSGSLSFVRVEYAGATGSALTFKGVGAGTHIDHCQSYASGHNGFTFRGGTVNARYLVSTASGENGFCFTAGYTGNLQFVVAGDPVPESVCCVSVSNGSDSRVADLPYTSVAVANLSADSVNQVAGIWYAAAIASNSRIVFINSAMRRAFVGKGLGYQLIGGRPPAYPELEYILVNTTPEESTMRPDHFRLDTFFVQTDYSGAVDADMVEGNGNWTMARWIKRIE